MPPRTIAIGDIHGCSAAFAAILAAIDIQPDDTLITLGDYVDRGIDSKGVLDQLIELESRCHLIPLMGNHEENRCFAREGASQTSTSGWPAAASPPSTPTDRRANSG